MPDYNAEFASAIDGAWLRADPIRLGTVPPGLGTPDRFVLLWRDSSPFLRVDLYSDSDEAHVFEALLLWEGCLAIGFGEHAFVVDLDARRASGLPLGGYFCGFHLAGASALIASAEHVRRYDARVGLRWCSPPVAVDGVVIDAVVDNLVRGSGECDPPGGWRPFVLEFS